MEVQNSIEQPITMHIFPHCQIDFTVPLSASQTMSLGPRMSQVLSIRQVTSEALRFGEEIA